MKKILTSSIFFLITALSFAQTKKIDLYDLIKKFVQDSTVYSTTGDWAVGHPATFPVQWKEDRVIMSDDIKINFYRTGNAMVSINAGAPSKWNVMLRGPRMGFTSFNISSTVQPGFHGKETIDSLLNKKSFAAKLLKSCDVNPTSGFYYYQVLFPKKVYAWMKIAWTCKNESCSINIDCYDDWSKQYAELDCK